MKRCCLVRQGREIREEVGEPRSEVDGNRHWREPKVDTVDAVDAVDEVGGLVP